MNKNVIHDYLCVLEKFNFTQVNEIQKGCNKAFKVDLPTMCGKIITLTKSEGRRKFFIGFCEMVFLAPVQLLVLFSSIFVGACVAQFLGSEHATLGFAGTCFVIFFLECLMAIQYCKQEAIQKDLECLRNKLESITKAINEVEPYVEDKRSSLESIATDTLDSIALKIITMERAMPEDTEHYSSTFALDEARRHIRKVANVFERAGIIDGSLDANSQWAKLEWAELAKEGAVSTDYVI